MRRLDERGGNCGQLIHNSFLRRWLRIITNPLTAVWLRCAHQALSLFASLPEIPPRGVKSLPETSPPPRGVKSLPETSPPPRGVRSLPETSPPPRGVTSLPETSPPPRGCVLSPSLCSVISPPPFKNLGH